MTEHHDSLRLIEHDQTMKAREAVASLPEQDSERKAVEELTAHVASPDAYQTYYKTMRGDICPEDQVFRRHEQVKRFAKIRELILERTHKTVLDLGCLDGWQLLNLAASGITGVGVDLCEDALAVGRERATKWGFNLRFIRSAIEDFDTHRWFNDDGTETKSPTFDAVLLSEVLEHVLDPVACLKVAAQHLAPGGIVYVSVPATPIPHHGKMEDAREHLRVFSEQGLIDAAKQAGLHRVVDHEVIPEQDQGQEFANRTISFRRATVSIHCAHVTGGWTPLKPESLGGSEEMVVKTAESWAKQGHDVTVYMNGPDTGTEHNGVVYLGRSQAPKADQDVLILFKSLDYVHIPAAQTILWTTDLPAPGQAATFLPPKLMDDLDAVVCISEYHRQELLKAVPWLNPAKVHQHWLGIDKDEIARAVAAYPKVTRRVLYASSYDRGLRQLLEAWPKVKESVPDAELHVTYGWDFWMKSEAVVPAPMAENMRQERKALDALLQQPGVIHKGRLSREETLREFAEAEVWAYPCTGGELCCKTALEAQEAGCVGVVIPTMALAETAEYCHHATHETFADDLIQFVCAGRRPEDIIPHCPSWDNLATWLFDLCDGKVDTTAAVDVPVVEEQRPTERFPIPSCTTTPPTRELSILMAVAGMPFDGNTDRTKDLGGSETAAIGLARALAKRGHSVTVFSNLPDKPGKFDGVTYLPIQEYARYAVSTPHDVSIIQRDPTGFNLQLQSKLNVLWCHDLGLKRTHAPFRSSLWNVDYVVPVSHWHGRQLCQVYDLPPDIMVPMNNGIDGEYIQQSIDKRGQRDMNAIVYASRPERGMDVLLQTVFPKLLERNPKLVLYLAGYANTVQSMEGFYQHCEQLARNLGPRVKPLGSLSKKDLYGVYSRAALYLYPQRNFKEVSCLSLLEASACGLPFVGTTLGALPETSSRVSGATALVEHNGKEATSDFIDRLVDEAWAILSNPERWQAMSEAGQQNAASCSWDVVAEEWENFLLGAFEQRSANKLRLARHWWRIGDIRGVEKLLPELTPGEATAFRHGEEIAEMADDPASVPTPHILNAVCNAIIQYKPKTVHLVGEQRESIAAQTISRMLGVDVNPEGPADCVVSIETLDVSTDPAQYIQDVEKLVTPGGSVCFVTAAPGVQQDRLHRGQPRRKRWVFDNHDLKDLFGKKPNLLSMVIEGGAASAYDGKPLAWMLHCYQPDGKTTQGVLNLARRKWLQSPQLSLTGAMIVKNGDEMLTRCLKSIAPYCDEMVIDDTGSTDTTPEILQRFGVTPGEGLNPVEAGFDAARNRGLERATGDAILWIDADECLLDPTHLPKYLRWSIYNGFAIQQHHFSAVPANAFKPDLPVRIFRRVWQNGKETGIRFIGRVHEHPELGLNQSVGQSIVLSDVHIAHDGYLTESTRRKRFDRNIALMYRDRATYPDRVLGKFLMIRDWIHLARYEAEKVGGLTPQAVQYLEAALDSYRKNFLGGTHQMAVDGLPYYNEALQILGRGFETQIVLKVGGVDGQPRELVYTGRVADRKDMETLIMGGVRDLSAVWDEEYL